MIDASPVPVHEGRELPDVLAELPRGDLLLPYQQRSLREAARHSLFVEEKSRRIGLTWAFAADAVLTAGAEKSAGGMDFMYISYAHDMTREFIDACAMWAKAFASPVAEISDEFLFDDQDEHGHTKGIKAFRIDFASGYSIVALSSAPRSLRGRQGKVLIDEAAFVNNLSELLKAALAFLIWGGRVIVISTHNGADNPFNLLLDQIRSGERKGGTLRVTFNDAMQEGFYERVCLMKGEAPTPEGKREFEADIRGYYGEAASEELDCVPSLGGGSLLSMEKIMACTHKDAGKPELYGKGLTTLGRDVAIRKTGDLSVIHATELVNARLWLRERWKKRGASFAEQDREFDRMFAFYNVLRAGIDQTGMGEKVVEDAKRRHGDRVEGILFSGPNRLDLALAIAKRFDDETIAIEDDPELRRDLRAIKKMKGAGSAVRIVDDGEVHADEFWALALCCLMAGDDPITCRGFIRAERPANKFREPAGDDDGDGRMRMRADEQRSGGGRFGRGGF